ncbi:uncharacterized protein LOC105159281 [Sesamum indicum]|uniref:Uncharacterized protein LOC105159281 n=1 Tax=Sesamum indicum TaxID=4182 RepID=A0A8M8UNX3_SESIN|nr:uncharacterized protein LOC105159281 [Sesamum indicum]
MTISWLHVILAAASVVILVLLLLLILQRCFHPKPQRIFVVSDTERGQSLQTAISRLHQVRPHHDNLDRDDSKKTNFSVSRHGVVPTEAPFFSWADHPSLVTDAVENGWPRFAFTTLLSSPSVKSARSLVGVCAGGSALHGNGINVGIGWEVCEGSADYMQKIRLNPGLKKVITTLNPSMGAVSVIRTALPLPGPQLGNASFPQEAYFEITILPVNEDINDQLTVDKAENAKSEGKEIRLIGEEYNVENNPESLRYETSSHSRMDNIEEVKPGGKQEVGKYETVSLSVGLTGGGPLPLKFPGSYPGSIGFNSSGSVYLNGTKLMLESEKGEWGRAEKVIGCGYNPAQKKVLFTVDSQLVHEIHCKTEEFGSPLYPTLAANADVVVVVNLGQSPFKFAPGNLQRTPNPCFIRPQQPTSPALGYEDSKELFSMGRIDSQWLKRSGRIRSCNYTENSIKGVEFELESEGDLFEIVLDTTRDDLLKNSNSDRI